MALLHYQDVVIDNTSKPVSNANLTVYLTGTQTLVSLFSDSAGTVPISNPTTTDSYGRFAFYVAGGTYDIQVSGNNIFTYTQTAVDVEAVGPQGTSGTISVGATTTVNPNVNPSVVNVGTSSAAIFDFSLPRAPVVSVGSTVTGGIGTSASVSNSGVNGDTVLNFTIPQGPQGVAGPGGGIGSVNAVSDCAIPTNGTDIATALTTCETNHPGATILFPQAAYTLNSSHTTAAGITYDFVAGAIIQGSGTLTANEVRAPITAQIFGGNIATTAVIRYNQIQYPQWRGAKGDGVTNDWAAISATVNNGWNGTTTNPYAPHVMFIKTHPQNGGPNLWGANTCDYYLGNSTLYIHAQATTIEGNITGFWDGGAKLCWSNASMTSPLVSVTGVNGYGANGVMIKYLTIGGDTGWTGATLTNYNFPNGNHGISMPNSAGQLDHVYVSNVLGHGIVLGNGAANGFGGVAGNDNWQLTFVNVEGAMGYGIFTGGITDNGQFSGFPADSSAGIGIDPLLYGNQMGGIGDFSRYPNVWTNIQTNANARGAIAAGATSAITSVSRTSGVVTAVTATPVSGLVVNTWVTFAGTGTTINEACHVLTVTDSQHFTCAQTGDPDVASVVIGTVGTSASGDVFTYYNTHQGNWPTGAFVAGNSTWISPYCEGNQAPALLQWQGNGGMLIGGSNCSSSLNTLVADSSRIITAGSGTTIHANASGWLFTNTTTSTMTIDFQAGLTTDASDSLADLRFMHHDGSTAWIVGQGPFNSWYIWSPTQGYSFYTQFGGETDLNAFGSGAVNFNSYTNSTGNVNFYSGGASPAIVASVSSTGKGTFNGGLVSHGGNVPWILFKDNANHNNTGDTLEHTIYTTTLPANTLGTSGTLLVRVQGKFINTTSGIVRVYFGGSNACQFGTVGSIVNMDATCTIGNTATNAQTIIGNSYGVGAGTIVGNVVGASLYGDLAIDTTVGVTVSVTYQAGNNGDTGLLKNCSMIIQP